MENKQVNKVNSVNGDRLGCHIMTHYESKRVNKVNSVNRLGCHILTHYDL